MEFQRYPGSASLGGTRWPGTLTSRIDWVGSPCISSDKMDLGSMPLTSSSFMATCAFTTMLLLLILDPRIHRHAEEISLGGNLQVGSISGATEIFNDVITDVFWCVTIMPRYKGESIQLHGRAASVLRSKTNAICLSFNGLRTSYLPYGA